MGSQLPAATVVLSDHVVTIWPRLISSAMIFAEKPWMPCFLTLGSSQAAHFPSLFARAKRARVGVNWQNGLGDATRENADVLLVLAGRTPPSKRP